MGHFYHCLHNRQSFVNQSFGALRGHQQCSTTHPHRHAPPWVNSCDGDGGSMRWLQARMCDEQSIGGLKVCLCFIYTRVTSRTQHKVALWTSIQGVRLQDGTKPPPC